MDTGSTDPAFGSSAGRVLFAFFVVALTTILKLGIGGWATHDEDVFFLAAIAIVAWLGGARAGSIAVFLAAAAQLYFFIAPAKAITIDSIDKGVPLGIWVLEGNALCLLVGALAKARTHAERAQRDAERGSRLVRRLFEASPTPTLAVDRETSKVLAANDAAARLYGYTREHLLAKKFDDLRAPGAATETLDEPGVVRHLRADGTTMKVEVVASPAHIDNRAARIVVVVDRSAPSGVMRIAS